MATYDEYKSARDTVQAPQASPTSGRTYDEYRTGGAQPQGPVQETPTQEPGFLERAGSAIAGAPGVSHLIQLSDALAERGSRAAGGFIRDLRQGNVANLPVALEEGLIENKGPEAIEQFREMGFRESPIPEAAVNALGGTQAGDAARLLRALTSPEAAATGASTLATLPVDVATGGALKGARAVSQIPKVAKALDVARNVTAPIGRRLSRGYALPSSMRNEIRDIVGSARGEENVLMDEVNDYLSVAQEAIEKAAKARKVSTGQQESRIRDLLEVVPRKPELAKAMTTEERAAYDALDTLREELPQMRERAGLKARRLGAHLEGEEALKEPGYTPRFFEGPAAKDLGIEPTRRQQELSQLGTRVPGVRDVRGMTTRQLEEAFEAGQASTRGPISKPFVPLLKAFEIRGASTARSAANARAVEQIALRFGTDEAKAGKGFRKLSDLNLFTGFNAADKAPLDKVHVNPEVFKYMDEFTRAADPKQIPLLTSFLKVWKPAVTSINPQFISRNVQWNGIIGWIRGNKDPRNWVDAGNVLGRANPKATVRGLKLTNEELRKELLQGRITGTGTMAEIGVSKRRFLKAGEQANIPKRFAGFMARGNQAAEDLARASFYIAMRRKGMAPKEAAERTLQTYFDYSRDAASPFINKLRDTGVPFLIWTRNILPLTFRSLVENPSAFAGFGAISRESARSAGLPEGDRRYLGPEYRDIPGVTLKPEPGDRPGTFRGSPLSQVGFYDAGRAVSDPRKYAFTQLSPLIQGAILTIPGARDAFSGKDALAPTELPPQAAFLAHLQPDIAEKLGIELATENRAIGPNWLNFVFRLSGPMGSAIFDASSGDPDQKLRGERYLTGVGVRRNLDPEKGKDIESIIRYKEGKESQARARSGGRLKSRIQQEEEE